jgi:hypothetical protein
MVVEDCKIPTKSMLTAKVVDINNLINYKFTQEELEEKLRKQGAHNANEKLHRRFELEKKIKTRAKTYHDVNTPKATPNKDGSAEVGNGTPTISATQLSGSPTKSQPKPKGIAVIRHRNMDDDNIAALDLDLDGDFDFA